MGIRSQNNPLAAYLDVFSNTGTDAMRAAGGTTGLTATGGIINDYTSGSDVYRAHIFTSSGALNVTALGTLGNTVDYLVVGGGGGGAQGSNAGGAGGAGGFRTNVPGTPHSTSALFPVSVSSYSIIIGAGGRPSGAPGGSGSNSTLDNGGPNPIVSSGGGAGGTVAGIDGGSGGGGGSVANSTVYPGGASTAVTTPSPWPGPATQGFAGGTGQHIPGNWEGGGGGGGAGSVGQNAGPSHKSGSGGIGIRATIAGPSYPIGAPGPDGSGGSQTGGWVAGGGGGYGNAQGSGGTWNGTAVQAGGPFAGGGQGAGPVSTRHGLPGTGGGGGSASTATTLGSGGSGIVVVRYKLAELTATAKATGGAISFYSGKTIHTFTNSGSFVVNSGPISAEFFIVAGGGGGGYDASGGGGAGGVVYHPGLSVSDGTYAVTIGAGGQGSLSQPTAGSDGADSVIAFPTSYTAYRGGGGGSRIGTTGQNGGSGGGGGRSNGSGGSAIQPASNPGATEYGNAGGAASDYAGGGGGAGFAGQPYADDTKPGWGGIGIQAPTSFRNPASSYGGAIPGTPGNSWGFAGGGGGGGAAQADGSFGGSFGPDRIPAGPYYGGGTGALDSPSPTETNTDGQENTGGGGGGGNNGPAAAGASGGSGIVLIAYPS